MECAWVITDSNGNIHGRITQADEKLARLIATSCFPEVPGVRILAWKDANRQKRRAAEQAALLTPRMCERAGIITLRRPAPGLPLSYSNPNAEASSQVQAQGAYR
jgi:hypothetical protein